MHLIAPHHNANINQSARENAVIYISLEKKENKRENINGNEIKLAVIERQRTF